GRLTELHEDTRDSQLDASIPLGMPHAPYGRVRVGEIEPRAGHVKSKPVGRTESSGDTVHAPILREYPDCPLGTIIGEGHGGCPQPPHGVHRRIVEAY